MKIKILFAAALLVAGSLQAQETQAHQYMIAQATAYGEIIQIKWRGLGHLPTGPQAVRELTEQAFAFGYTSPGDRAEFIRAAQVAAYKYDSDLNAATQQ